MLLSKELVDLIKNEMQTMTDRIKSGEITEKEYMGHFEVEAEQTQRLQVKVTGEGHTFFVDETEPFGANKGPAPVYYFLGAYAACFEMNMITFCVMSNLNVESIKINISATMDGRDNFKSSDAPPVRLKTLTLRAVIHSDESEAKLDRIFKKAKRNCVIGGSLHADIEKTYLMEIIPNS